MRKDILLSKLDLYESITSKYDTLLDSLDECLPSICNAPIFQEVENAFDYIAGEELESFLGDMLHVWRATGFGKKSTLETRINGEVITIQNNTEFADIFGGDDE